MRCVSPREGLDIQCVAEREVLRKWIGDAGFCHCAVFRGIRAQGLFRAEWLHTANHDICVLARVLCRVVLRQAVLVEVGVGLHLLEGTLEVARSQVCQETADDWSQVCLGNSRRFARTPWTWLKFVRGMFFWSTLSISFSMVRSFVTKKFHPHLTLLALMVYAWFGHGCRVRSNPFCPFRPPKRHFYYSNYSAEVITRRT